MQTIPCTLEILSNHSEVCWMLSISVADVEKTALHFIGLEQGILPKIVFCDHLSKQTLTVCSDSVTVGNRSVSTDKIWLDALCHLLLNTYFNGWTDTAHLDAEFSDQHGSVCLTISIEIPK